MPNYLRFGKVLVPLSEKEFIEGMVKGHFCDLRHKGFVALLYHTGVRKGEALRAVKEQFSLHNNTIHFDVLKRLKHGKITPPLPIPLSKPFSEEIWRCVEDTKPHQKVWSYSSKTGFNIVARVFKYPHHMRLTKITNLAAHRDAEGKRFTLAQLQNWTGLSLGALNFYIGLVDISEMAEA